MAHKAFRDLTHIFIPTFSSFVLFGLATMASLLGSEYASLIPTSDPFYLPRPPRTLFFRLRRSSHTLTSFRSLLKCYISTELALTTLSYEVLVTY